MRLTTTVVAAALMIACAPKAEDATPDSAETAEATAVSPVANYAGTWNLTTTLEGVAEPVQSSITGTADLGSWSMTLDGRDPVPLEVAMRSDSMVTESAEYESILRKGVMVRVRTAVALSGDMMMGTMVATYRTPAGEELVKGTVHGSRAAP